MKIWRITPQFQSIRDFQSPLTFIKLNYFGKTIFGFSLKGLYKTNFFEMVSLAIKHNPSFELSLIEVQKPGNTYTCETLETLKATHSDIQYFFIIGADTLFQIEKWQNPKQIFAMATLLRISGIRVISHCQCNSDICHSKSMMITVLCQMFF